MELNSSENDKSANGEEELNNSNVVQPFFNLDEETVKAMLNKLSSVYTMMVNKGTTPLMRRAWEKFK